MDIIAFNEGATANGRIEKFNANPDSNSGVLTQPKVIEAGETVTIKSGRRAILADTVIDGDLVIEAGGDVFVPAGAGFGDLDQRIDTKLDKDFSSFTNKPTPVDTDNFVLQETGGLLKKLSWINLKATLFNGAISLTQNGYIKLPTIMGGLTIQWGEYTATMTHGAEYTVTFPISFSNDCFQILNTIGNTVNTGTTAIICPLRTKTKSSFSFQYGAINGVAYLSTVRYIAVGH